MITYRLLYRKTDSGQVFTCALIFNVSETAKPIGPKYAVW